MQQLITTDKMAQIAAIDDTRRSAQAAISQAIADKNETLKALVTASAMETLRQQLTTELMQDVMRLMNSPLGFRTDRDPARDPNAKPYAMETVRDCVITAILSGFALVGNEWNIIGGNFYGAQAGYYRTLQRFPGLAAFHVDLEPPRMSGDKGALVTARATWTLHGTPDCMEWNEKGGGIDNRLCIRVNKGMGPDAIHGKARRKIYAAVVAKLTGFDAEAGDSPPPGIVDADGPRQKPIRGQRTRRDCPECKAPMTYFPADGDSGAAFVCSPCGREESA